VGRTSPADADGVFERDFDSWFPRVPALHSKESRGAREFRISALRESWSFRLKPAAGGGGRADWFSVGCGAKRTMRTRSKQSFDQCDPKRQFCERKEKFIERLMTQLCGFRPVSPKRNSTYSKSGLETISRHGINWHRSSTPVLGTEETPRSQCSRLEHKKTPTRGFS